jgi:hypothetical protein
MAKRYHVAFSAIFVHWLREIMICQHKHGQGQQRIMYIYYLIKSEGTIQGFEDLFYSKQLHSGICHRKTGLWCWKHLVFGEIFPAVTNYCKCG